MLTIRLPESTEERLSRLAKETGRTKSFYVKEALKNYLEDLEDIYLSDKVVDRIRKGEEDVISSEEMGKIQLSILGLRLKSSSLWIDRLRPGYIAI